MPVLLPPTCLSLYLTLVCLHFSMCHLSLTNTKTKFHFISLAVKSNVYILFFDGGTKFHFVSHGNTLLLCKSIDWDGSLGCYS